MRNRHPPTFAALLATPLLLLAGPLLAAETAPAPLIPREALFTDPERIAPVLSPDGQRLAWIERAPWGSMRPRIVTLGQRDTVSFLREGDGMDWVEWAGDGHTLLTLRQREGDENWHLWALDTRTGDVRDLTPYPEVRAEQVFTHPRYPNEVLVALNRRDPRIFDLWRVNLQTGEARFDTRNPGDIVTWSVDPAFQVRAAVALDPRTSDTKILYRARGDSTWKVHQVWPFRVAGMDRDQRILGFRPDGNAIYLQNGIGTNTSHIVESELGTRKERLVVPHHPRADLWNQPEFIASEGHCSVLFDPRSGQPVAAAVNELKPSWFTVDSKLAPDLKLLGSRHGGVFDITSKDTLDHYWVVRWERDTASGIYELYDRRTRTLQPLFESNPVLGTLPLVPMKTVTATARDGKPIPCYLTLPRDAGTRKPPLIVMPHGGPWFRDEWGYNPDIQWLANRGYAVLQPQFRGSTGFGVEWLNAGDHQFGRGQVLLDIIDAGRWVTRQGLADSTRMGIMGGSFGGYATLSALAFYPGTFQCGVDVVGPSDLGHLISTFPSYWEARRRRWLNRMGDVLNDQELNRSMSPLYHADAITAPLLVGHGANDPRAKLEASERIVKALRDRGREVTFVVYPDEGHGFQRAENKQDFSARVEEFLAKHLGGRAIPRARVMGTSAELR